MAQRPSFKERFHYRMDNFFSRGGPTIFLVLVTLTFLAFLLMGSLRVLVNSLYQDPLDQSIHNFGEQVWRSLLQILDIGAMENDSPAGLLNRSLGVATALIGLTCFTTILAFVTSFFKEKLESLRKGNSSVIEENHTLILGFGIRTVEIIRELIEANESEDDAAVVILAEEDKEMMDDFFKDALPYRATTRIITRTGTASSTVTLRKVGVDRCKSVIILNSANPADPPAVKTQGDYLVLKTIMAILAAVGTGEVPPIVAKFFFSRNRTLALGLSPGNISAIDEDLVLSKILVQTSRIPGLAMVYSDLVGFMGNEVYFNEIPSFLLGKSFGEFQFHFKQSVPLGLRTPDGQILLNPPADRILGPEEEAIILAEDDSTIHFYPEPVFTPTPRELSSLKAKTREESYIIFGWNRKSPVVLEEYAQYIKGNSRIDMVVKKITPEIQAQFDRVHNQFPDLNMSLKAVNFAAMGFPEQLKPEQYGNVIILAGEGKNTEEIDSETISLLLKFRAHFQNLENKSGNPVETQLITEVMDSENTEIIQQTGVKDFLISNQFVSKIMAQISEEPAVNQVYEDLFSEGGSEIYIKRADLYLTDLPGDFPFGDLVALALQRGEVCFGVKMESGQLDEANAYGVHIIPEKDKTFRLTAEDRLIVLAVDEF